MRLGCPATSTGLCQGFDKKVYSMLPRMNGGKAPMAIYSGFTGNHAILAVRGPAVHARPYPRRLALISE